MRESYKDINNTSSLPDFINWAIHATRARIFDREDFDKQISENPRIFNAPSSSSDLRGNEKAGDIAVDTSYFYIVADNAGTLQWQRVAISTF